MVCALSSDGAVCRDGTRASLPALGRRIRRPRDRHEPVAAESRTRLRRKDARADSVGVLRHVACAGSDVLDEGSFLHGTKADLRNGDSRSAERGRGHRQVSASGTRLMTLHWKRRGCRSCGRCLVPS